MKVIFLDFNGVLNDSRTVFDRDKYGDTFHTVFVDNLKYIIDSTNAKIVITSSYRMSGLTIMKRLWTFREMPGIIIDIIPYIINATKGDEINNWLSKNIVNKYVILDDIDQFNEYQQIFFIKTNFNKDHKDSLSGLGLTRVCAEKAIDILNSK